MGKRAKNQGLYGNYPETIIVKIEQDNSGNQFLTADRDARDAIGDKSEVEVGIYKFVRKTKVRSKIEVE